MAESSTDQVLDLEAINARLGELVSESTRLEAGLRAAQIGLDETREAIAANKTARSDTLSQAFSNIATLTQEGKLEGEELYNTLISIAETSGDEATMALAERKRAFRAQLAPGECIAWHLDRQGQTVYIIADVEDFAVPVLDPNVRREGVLASLGFTVAVQTEEGVKHGFFSTFNANVGAANIEAELDTVLARYSDANSSRAWEGHFNLLRKAVERFTSLGLEEKAAACKVKATELAQMLVLTSIRERDFDYVSKDGIAYLYNYAPELLATIYDEQAILVASQDLTYDTSHRTGFAKAYTQALDYDHRSRSNADSNLLFIQTLEAMNTRGAELLRQQAEQEASQQKQPN